ncbi:MAG: transcriptional repressor [Coriobacteriales bacterium]|nr:transcriptional repressor [Coriobacteriales bacterium]
MKLLKKPYNLRIEGERETMNKRNSVQKRVIGQALMMMDHPTATEVYERVRREHPQISLGTVYRNLGTMANEGDVLRLSFPNSPDRFDPNTYEHCHAVCTCCGQVLDTDGLLPHELIEQIDRAVERNTGVRVESHSLVFSGMCDACQSK